MHLIQAAWPLLGGYRLVYVIDRAGKWLRKNL